MMKANSWISSIMLLFFCSACMKVDTNPKMAFSEVQSDAYERTGYETYWDQKLDGMIKPLSVDEILHKKLSEENVVEIALLNNKNLQAMYESLGMAKADLAQAGLLRNPIFSLSYRFSTKSGVTDLIDMGLLQNFLDIFLIPLKKRVASSELEATKARALAAILDVIGQTRIAYYNMQAFDRIWEMKKEMLLAAELAFDASQRLRHAGNITELEVEFNQANLEQSKLDLATWEVMLLKERERLNVLMGLWGEQIEWKLANHLPKIPEQEESYSNIENRACAQSLDLKIDYQELNKIAAEYGVDTTKVVFSPVELGVSAEREDLIWYVGPSLNLAIPLFDLGKANSAKARARIMQKWNEYTARAVAIRSDARMTRVGLLNAFRQSRYLSEVIVPLAEKITDTTYQQNNAMQLSLFRLLDAKQNELIKKIQSIEMQRDYWIAKVTMETLLQGRVLRKEVVDPGGNVYVQ